MYSIDFVYFMFAFLRFLHLKLNKCHYICADEFCQEMN